MEATDLSLSEADCSLFVEKFGIAGDVMVTGIFLLFLT
jgi:hypothetical protein